MSQTSFALLTTTGRQKEAAALGGGDQVVVTHIAIGDGATVPSGGESELYNETARKTISGQGVVSGAENTAYADTYLTAAEGPYTIREAGLIDEDGDLIAIAHFDPPISKPTPDSGQTVAATIRIEVAFSDLAAVTILVDPSMTVALQRLSVLPWIPVKSVTTTEPPASPAIGDTYVIPAGATGVWSGHAQKTAEYTSAGWAIVPPKDGHGIGLPDGGEYIRVNGVYRQKAHFSQVSNADIRVLGFQAAPPVSPTEGDIYIVNGAGSGDWSGHDYEIALYIGDAWTFAEPLIGQQANAIVNGVYRVFYFDGLVWRLSSVRTALTANTNFYIDGAAGDDGNDGSIGAPWATFQGAWEYLQAKVDLNGFNAIVSVADGTYTAGLGAAGLLVGQRSATSVQFVGNEGSPTSCTVDVANGSAFLSTFRAQYSVNGFEPITTGTGINQGYAVGCQGGSVVFKNLIFGSQGQAYIFAQGGSAQAIGNNVGAGSIPSGKALWAAQDGTIQISGQTFNFNNGISFQTTAFCEGGLIAAASATLTGTVTAKRYEVALSGTISTNGAGVNHFPGSIAGTKDATSSYV